MVALRAEGGGADDVLPDLEANGQAALVFRAGPTDDRACQVKGVFVGRAPATTTERAVRRAPVGAAS